MWGTVRGTDDTAANREDERRGSCKMECAQLQNSSASKRPGQLHVTTNLVKDISKVV